MRSHMQVNGEGSRFQISLRGPFNGDLMNVFFVFPPSMDVKDRKPFIMFADDSVPQLQLL